MAKIIQLVPVLTMLIVLSALECSSSVSTHDNAVIQLAKSIKSIELLLRESNSNLKKMASSRVNEGIDRSAMDQTILRTARPATSGARSASGHRSVYRSKLERIDDSQAKIADDTKPTASSSSRVKRPASNDNDPSKTIDQTKQERGHKGDDVLAAINTMIKRRYNDNNINTNFNKNDNTNDQSEEKDQKKQQKQQKYEE